MYLNRAQRRNRGPRGWRLHQKIINLRNKLIKQGYGIMVGRAEDVPTGKYASGYYGVLVEFDRS